MKRMSILLGLVLILNNSYGQSITGCSPSLTYYDGLLHYKQGDISKGMSKLRESLAMNDYFNINEIQNCDKITFLSIFNIK